MVVRVKEYYLFPLVFSLRGEDISARCFLMDPFFIRCYLFPFPRRMVVDMVKYKCIFLGTYFVRVASVDLIWSVPLSRVVDKSKVKG